MSLIKIPCILVATIGMYHCFTPPNVAPKKELMSRKTISEHVIFVAKGLFKPFGIVMWAVGLAEVAVIAANHIPSWSLSERIISGFLVRRNPQELQLTPASVIGVLLIASGGLLRVWCYRVLSRFFTFELSIREGHKLITTGPYSIVRHPSYTGVVFVFIGMICWLGSRGSWLRESGVLETIGGKVVFGILGAAITGSVTAALMRMPAEESMLKEKFGREWIEWARRVPYLIIPGVF